ncbi:MAG: PorP/SprF family type IX secretion system membrane protein [Crocinitomicaceae bacterium]|jgi:type IX secretion system PorP/SprF family membrane protein
MKRISLILSLVLSSISFGQNTTRFAQINFAQGVNNPAAIAHDGLIMADMIFRNQWLGVEGAPTTIAFNGQYEINEDHAVGLNIYHDRIGVHNTTSFSAQYAYRAHLDNVRSFSFGLSLGADNVVNDLAASQTSIIGDPVFSTSYSSLFFNGSFGIYYNAPKFYFGASIPQLFQNTIRGKQTGFEPQRWHYYVSTGIYLDAGDNFTFNPHLQLKTALDAPMQADLILRNTIRNRFSIVVGYRTTSAIIAGVDFLISKNARIGYSFNYDVGTLAKTKGGSNELYFGLAFPYHSDRGSFAKRRYLGRKKGTYNRNYTNNSHRRQNSRGNKYGRDTRNRRRGH